MAVSHVQSCPFFATQTPKLVMRPRIAAKRGAKPTIGNYFFAVYIVHTLPIGFKLFLKEQYDSFQLDFFFVTKEEAGLTVSFSCHVST